MNYMVDNADNGGSLPDEFGSAARKTVRKLIEVDEDIADWLKSTFGKDWQSEVNSLLRFYKDTNAMTPADAEPGSGPAARWEL